MVTQFPTENHRKAPNIQNDLLSDELPHGPSTLKLLWKKHLQHR